MLTGTAVSSTPFSLGQEDSLLDLFSHTGCGALSLRSVLGTRPVSQLMRYVKKNVTAKVCAGNQIAVNTCVQAKAVW